MLPKLILCPTDFGEPSRAATDYAVTLAKALDSEIVLMHAFEIPMIGFPDGALVATADLTSKILEGAQAGLDRESARVADAGVKVRTLVKQGDAPTAICETASEIGADLVCVGTHGRRGLPRALLGSVAEKVVRMAHVPVLAVHAGPDEQHAKPVESQRSSSPGNGIAHSHR
jgi:nucleotide-binding universal stress UspA family protein